MSFSKTVYRWLVTAATLGALLSFGSMFSAHHLVFDLLSHFRVQYIVLLLPAYILAIMTRRTGAVLVISLALALHGYVVAMSYLPRSGLGTDNEHSTLTVLSSNLLRSNTNSTSVIDLIHSASPDIIAFQEYTDEWHRVLSSSLSDYPHKVAFPKSGSFGIAIYSKYPFSNKSEQPLTVKSNPHAWAEIELDGKNIELFAIHPVPPVNTGAYENRNIVLNAIAQETKDADHAVVMGDFNATPWTAHYTNMTSIGKLHNARAGFGFHTTWPTHIPVVNFILQIPIDHILITDRIRATAFNSKVLEGSDHRAIWSTLSIY